MNKRNIFILTILLAFTCFQAIGQDYEEHDVDEFYKKIDLDYGTLDESGQSIDFIFVKTDLKSGKYEIEIADGPGDLNEIKGTDTYVKFRGYYGYAGYGEEGMLVVGTSAYLSTFYKRED
jgi:hypothetical protein